MADIQLLWFNNEFSLELDRDQDLFLRLGE